MHEEQETSTQHLADLQPQRMSYPLLQIVMTVVIVMEDRMIRKVKDKMALTKIKFATNIHEYLPLFIYLSIYLFTYLPIYLTTCLFIIYLVFYIRPRTFLVIL